MHRCVTLLVVVLLAAWPGLANAARLSSGELGPPVGTTVDGFTEVMGPSATEPEHAYEFIAPQPEPCPYCPARIPAASAPSPSPIQH